MTISTILSEKGRHVVTATPGVTLQQTAQQLMTHGIGALVIVDASGSVLGLISERDIVAAVAVHGARALGDPVVDHMQTNPLSVVENDTIDATMKIMTLERRRHMPVLREMRLSGVISIGDVVRHRIRVIEEEHRSMRAYIAQG